MNITSLTSAERTELLTSYFDNYTFEISQFIGGESTHVNEIFSTQFYENVHLRSVLWLQMDFQTWLVN